MWHGASLGGRSQTRTCRARIDAYLRQMGLMVHCYTLPAEVSLDALAARVAERVGETCTLRDGRLRCRRLGASAHLVRGPETLEAQVMLPALPYFMLQVDLAVADLGGRSVSLLDNEPLPAPTSHPHAALRWSELPTSTRLAEGRVGSFFIGAVVVALTAIILLTLPLQLVLPASIKERAKAALSRIGTRAMLRG